MVIAKKALVAGGLALALASGLASAQSFTLINFLPGFDSSSEAFGISADGLVVVGVSNSAASNQAFKWTSSGVAPLPYLPGGGNLAVAYACNADGSLIVGEATNANGQTEAVLWSGATATGLGGVGPAPADSSSATAISADGSIIAGFRGVGADTNAFRYTGGVLTDIGDVPGGDNFALVNNISADGNFIVGVGSNADGDVGFRWSSGFFVELPDLAGGAIVAEATACSTDGAIVVGKGNPGSGVFSKAVRWIGSDPPVDLGDLPGGIVLSKANACSADGTVVVGYGTTGIGREGMIWTPTNGMRRLADVLTTAGATIPADQVIVEVKGVSADGQVFTGYTRPVSAPTTGPRRAFVASLRPAAPACVADVDDGSGTGTPDGGVTIEDLLFYLVVFGDGNVRADVDDGSGTGTPDGGVTIEDLLYFLLRFSNGC